MSEQEKQPTTHIEVTEEQKIKLRGYLKLMDEAERTGRDFNLFDYLFHDDMCSVGPFPILSQEGDRGTYRCEACGATFIRRVSVAEKDWKHYLPGHEPEKEGW